jgi:hypothetical protein
MAGKFGDDFMNRLKISGVKTGSFGRMSCSKRVHRHVLGNESSSSIQITRIPGRDHGLLGFEVCSIVGVLTANSKLKSPFRQKGNGERFGERMFYAYTRTIFVME